MSVQANVEAKLREKLAPEHLEVINESHMHSVPKGSETHFKVVVVSSQFEGMSPVKRHQLVYGALADELSKKPVHGGIHALAITSRTPAEWAASPEANVSPKCASAGK
ncbi:MAG: BolA family transcriptional regulator [Labilithrix sp.]|nr:BolA family transcriptional regulator [Labilithrix sp.]